MAQGGAAVTIVDASTPSDSGPVIYDASDCNCLPVSLHWGNNGGNARYVEDSAVAPCKTYSRMRDYMANAPPTTCKQELLACGSNSIGIGDLTGALRNADVQQAVRSAPVLYGGDPRPVDGTVLRVTIGGAVIDIGTPCAGGGACKAIPPGVAALGQVLALCSTSKSSANRRARRPSPNERALALVNLQRDVGREGWHLQCLGPRRNVDSA